MPLRFFRCAAPLVVALSFLSCKQLIEKLDRKDEAAKVPGAVASASAAPSAASPDVSKSTLLAGFEGVMVVKAKGSGEKEHSIRVHAKGSKLRFDIPEGEHLPPGVAGAYAIVSVPEKKLFLVVESKKQVVVVDFERVADDMKQMSPPRTPAERDPAPASLRKTGEKATIAGISCEDWEVTTKRGEKTKLCVAEESASWFSAPDVALPPEHGWAKELFDGKHFPIRFIGFDDKTTESVRIELASLEKKLLEDSLFAVPNDYQKLDLGEFVRSAMAGAFGAGALGSVSLPPGAIPLPANLPPEVKKQIEEMRAKAAAQKNSRSR